MQLQLHLHENSASNETILEDNKQRFSNQCRVVLTAMMRGERLTTSSALRIYDIGDLRARVRDLSKFNDVIVSKKLLEKRFKQYYLEPDEIERLKSEGW